MKLQIQPLLQLRTIKLLPMDMPNFSTSTRAKQKSIMNSYIQFDSSFFSFRTWTRKMSMVDFVVRSFC
jgi:hypothetical protein